MVDVKNSTAIKAAKKQKTAAKPETTVKPEVEEPVQIESKLTGKTVVGKSNREIGIVVPEHILNVAYIVRDNAAIRRYTSLLILKTLTNYGKIDKNASGKYVKFLWNKFRVTANGLTNEYSYKETFFLKALAESFGMFSKDAEATIEAFMDKEGIAEIK